MPKKEARVEISPRWTFSYKIVRFGLFNEGRGDGRAAESSTKWSGYLVITGD